MKIVTFSDSHGNTGILRDAVQQAMRGAPIDVCVHCGDGARDMDAIAPILRDANPNVRIVSVRGNCDLCAFDVPALDIFKANGVTMLATHGHLYNVKTEYQSLLSAARERSAAVVFFGHTHRPLLENVYGTYLINPGAICAHMPGNIAYAQVTVDATGKLRADLMKWLV